MAIMERAFLGVWLPKEIYLHKGLTPTEKLLLAEINSFSKNGVCFASNEHFSEFLGITKKHVSKLITKLSKMELVKVDLTYKKGTKEVEKRLITPIRFYEDTPTHSGVDPHLIEADTPTHSGVDPHLIEAYYKEQVKEQDKEQDKNKKNTKKVSIPKSQLDNEFEKLWDIYPLKRGDRQKAYNSFTKARKVKKIPYESIENGLLLYIRHVEQNGIEERFIPHGSTWFNQERWRDEYSTVTTKKQPKNALDYFKQQYGGNSYESNGNGEIIDHYTEVLPNALQGF
jgi:hypothetical protein